MYCALSLALPFNYSLLYAICQHFGKKSETYKIRLTFILLLYFRIKIRLFLLFCKHFFCLYLINEFQCTCLLYTSKEIDEREYMIEGSTNLDDLNDRLDLQLESEDYDSLGGFIIEHLDRLPEEGDSITTEDGLRLVVESLDKNRIESVHAYLPEPSVETEDDASDS